MLILIINEENGKIKQDKGIYSIMTDNKIIKNQNRIADVFNNYFISIADSARLNNTNPINPSITNPSTYLTNLFKRPFTKMSWQYTSTHEIEKIIKTIKTTDPFGYDEISSRIIKVLHL